MTNDNNHDYCHIKDDTYATAIVDDSSRWAKTLKSTTVELNNS